MTMVNTRFLTKYLGPMVHNSAVPDQKEQSDWKEQSDQGLHWLLFCHECLELNFKL